MGKGENAGNQHFLLFPQCFLPFSKQIEIFYLTFKLSSADAFNLELSKILSFGKELKAFSEAILNMAQMIKVFLERGENMRTEESAGYLHFIPLFSPNFVSKAITCRLIKNIDYLGKD